MARFTVISKLPKVTEFLLSRIKNLYDKDKLLRTVATTMNAVTANRIHNEGIKSDGTLIKPGGYSLPYLKLRQKKYNRTGDSKVILSLTRQMENDYTFGTTSTGSWALGFLNKFNANKAGWNEDRFGDVYRLTIDEIDLSFRIILNDISKIINS